MKSYSWTIKTFAKAYSPKVVWIKTKIFFVNVDLRSTSLMRQAFNLWPTPTLYKWIDFEISCFCSITTIVRNLVAFGLCAFIPNGNGTDVFHVGLQYNTCKRYFEDIHDP